MQILMPAESFQRTRSRLSSFGEALDVITFEADGTFRRDGAPVSADTIDPEIFWMSLDVYSGPNPGARLAAFASQVLKGTKGRWIQVFSAGLDHPLFKGLMDKGLRLTKSQAQSPAIADYVLAHAVSLLHPIAEQAAAQVTRTWLTVPFREIGSTRWLLVGYGAIGQEIARRVKPFDAHLTVVRRNLEPDAMVDAVQPMSALPKLLPETDVVVLACALNAETRNLADAAFFAAMKPGALLINIGRGLLVDEDALRAGLDRGQPGQAVLDVFHIEPLPADSWIWTHPAIRVTAHASHAGDGVAGRGESQFLENLRRFLDGQALIAEARPDEAGTAA
jgi:phosphoglycerate dehydrogenase-like enzyme